MSEDSGRAISQLEGPWVVILDQPDWNNHDDRPVLEDGIRDKQEALDVIGRYADGDSSDPINYRAIRPEWVDGLDYEVRVDA